MPVATVKAPAAEVVPAANNTVAEVSKTVVPVPEAIKTVAQAPENVAAPINTESVAHSAMPVSPIHTPAQAPIAAAVSAPSQVSGIPLPSQSSEKVIPVTSPVAPVLPTNSAAPQNDKPHHLSSNSSTQPVAKPSLSAMKEQLKALKELKKQHKNQKIKQTKNNTISAGPNQVVVQAPAQVMINTPLSSLVPAASGQAMPPVKLAQLEQS